MAVVDNSGKRTRVIKLELNLLEITYFLFFLPVGDGSFLFVGTVVLSCPQGKPLALLYFWRSPLETSGPKIKEYSSILPERCDGRDPFQTHPPCLWERQTSGKTLLSEK